ncbi:hypothetical protein [Kineococcus esterisolvens]|uniref:hypothetical protein n=1 Tax=unclassified Kineococcus TaxID=2621656 RepID=UPI003D7E531E
MTGRWDAPRDVRRRAVLAVTGGALLGGCGRSSPPPSPPAPVAPSRGAAGPGTADVSRLLAERGRALAVGDVSAAGAVCAPGSPSGAGELRRADTAAVRAGLVSWAVDLQEVAGGRARGRLRVRVAGEGREVAGRFGAALVPRDGGWALALPDPACTPQPWDLGEVRAHRVAGGTVLLVRPAGFAGATGTGEAGGVGEAEQAEEVARRVAADLPGAAARVDAAWGAGRPGGTAVVVVPTTSELARLAGLGPGRAAALDAVAVGEDSALADGAPAGVRVVLAADRCARLTPAGRTATLTHELVHAATRATATARPGPDGTRPVPRWLTEGYADHVARRDLDVPAALLAAPLLEAVAGGASPAPPEDADFDGTGRQLQVAYAAAWTLVTSAARVAGTPAVTVLLRSLSTAPELGGAPAAPRGQRLDAACRAVLGAGWADVQRTWRADVAAGLVGWGS